MEKFNLTKRLSFDQYLIALAFTASLRSEDPFTKVGCVGADEQHRILSTGYNGLKASFTGPEEMYQNRESPLRKRLIIHAEMNMLLYCKDLSSLHTVAITHSPCRECAKLLAAANVKRVLFAQLYPREQEFKEIFDFYRISWQQIFVDLSQDIF